MNGSETDSTPSLRGIVLWAGVVLLIFLIAAAMMFAALLVWGPSFAPLTLPDG